MASADRVEIRVTAPGLNESVRSFRELDQIIRQARTLKIAENSNLNNLRRQIDDTRNAIQQLRSEMVGGGTQAQRSFMTFLQAELRDLDEQADAAKDRIRQFNQVISEGNATLQNWSGEIEGAVNALEHLGSALELAGKASGWTKDFADSIGSAFSKMADVFDFNVFDKVGTRLTELVTDSFVGDMGKIVSRYDIMSTFTNYMKLAGVEADDAANALQRVNDAILGLPIGLDESAQRLRRYQMFLGDLDKATNLTIGLQNAVYAGGANEQMRTTAFYQIDRLLSVGKLNTARQWNALIQGLGTSMRFVAEEMGLGYENVNQFAQGLADGSISTNDFLNAIMRLGEGTSDAAMRLQEALNIYKGTIESWLNNIQFAAVRGGENVLKALEFTLSESTGKGITDYLKSLRDSINDVYTGASAWIKTNPEPITKNIDAFERLLDAMSRFSASNVAVQSFDYLARGIDMLTHALNSLPKEDVEQFLAFASTVAGPLGTLFSKTSQGAGIMLGVFQRFKDFDFEMLFDKIMRQVELMATVVEKLLSVMPDEALANLIAFGLVWGGPLSKVFGTAGAAVGVLATHLEHLALVSGSAHTALLTLAGALPAIATSFAGVAASAAFLFATLNSSISDSQRELVRNAEKAVNELGFGKMASSGEKALQSYRNQAEVVSTELDATMKKADEVERIFESLANVRTKVESGGISLDKGLSEQASLIARLTSIVPDVSLAYDESTGLIDKNSEALIRNGKAVAENIRQQAKAQAAKTMLEKSYQAQFEAEAAGEKLIEENKKIYEEREALRKKYLNTENYSVEERLGFKAEYELLGEVLRENRSSISMYAEALRHAREDEARYAREVENTANALDSAGNSAGDYAQKTEEALADLRKAYDDLHEASQKTVSELFPGTGMFEKQKTIGIGTINQEVDSQISAQKELDKNLDDIEAFLLRNPQYQGGLGDYFQQLVETGDLQRLQGLGDAVRKANDGVKDAIDALDDLDESRREYNKKKFELANEIDFASLMDDMGAEEAIKWLVDNDIKIENVPQEYVEQLAQKLAEEKARVKKEALKLAKEDSYYGTEEGEKEAGWLPPEGQLITDEEKQRAANEVAQKYKEIEEEAAALLAEEDDTSLAGGLNASKDLIAGLLETDFPALDEALGDLALNETTLTTAVNNVKTATTEAIYEVIRALENLMLKITAVRLRAETEFPIVVNKINEVKQAVNELIAALVLLTGTTWAFSVEGDIPGPPGGGGEGGGEGGPHTGGYIAGPGQTPRYYAKGGLIFPRPRGTDTIPAMLTPGEYVMRRGAVDQLGVPFLQRLNRMDIAGALDNLMHRFYRPSQAAYSVVNNSSDNRAYNVNVYNYQSTEDYTYRVAAKFAHAL